MSRSDDDIPVGCVLAAVVLGLPLLLGGCYGLSGVKVSDGYRDSTVRKVSETGVIRPTWEVETLGDGFRLKDGAASPETFNYTVSDPAVLDAIRSLPAGKRVRIQYRKHATVWAPRGETRYFITGVEVLPDLK